MKKIIPDEVACAVKTINQKLRVIGDTLVLQDIAVGVEVLGGKVVIRTYEIYKTSMQKKYGGYTVDKMIDKHEVQR